MRIYIFQAPGKFIFLTRAIIKPLQSLKEEKSIRTVAEFASKWKFRCSKCVTKTRAQVQSSHAWRMPTGGGRTKKKPRRWRIPPRLGVCIFHAMGLEVALWKSTTAWRGGRCRRDADAASETGRITVRYLLCAASLCKL